MPDRKTNYFGELIPETDNLQAQQFAMTGLAYACAAFLGTGTVVDGFTCIPTTPASLNVQLTPGAVYQLEPVEATTWSSLPTNSESILKQGILHTVDTIGITPPGTVGFSQVFLIEAQYADLDTTPVLLPYYNAANPSQPFQGPNNSGQSQNTVRLGIASIQVKAGIAAATGTQVAPTPDAGWTGMFLVTVANGQSTITAGNIAVYNPSPFIPTGAKLPILPNSVQNNAWTYWSDTGTADALVITPTAGAPPTAYVAGQGWIVKKSAAANATTTPTFAVIGSGGVSLGAKTITDRKGNALAAGDLPASADLWLVYDGTNFRNMGVVSADFGPLHVMQNVQQITNATRVVLSSITGTSATILSGSFTKKSATSNLIFWFTSPTYTPGPAGPAYAVLTIGGVVRNGPASNNDSTLARGSTVINGIITGVAAGTVNWTYTLARADAVSWNATVNPTSTDNAYLPGSGINTSLMIAEIEP